MRTSGPLLPSGRSPVSTSSGGSALGVPSRARTCSATPTDHLTATDSSTPEFGSHTNITSASEPYPSSPPPSRPMPITAIRAGTPESGVLARITTSSAAWSTATHTAVSDLHTSITSSMPSTSAEAIRASSRRRSVRAAAIARTGSAYRLADATSARARLSRSSSSSFGPLGPSAYIWMTSGARINNSGMYAEVPSTRMRRLATAPSSRSVPRNQRRSECSSLRRR